MADDVKKAAVRHAQADMANMGPEPAAPAQPASRKIGEEHAMGMLKLGAHELTQALAAFPDSNIRPMEEPGVAGNASMPHIVQEQTYNPADHVRPGGEDKSRGRSR